MATPIVREVIGVDEIFGLVNKPVPEVQNPRTSNMGDMMDPNWGKDLEKFELDNAKEAQGEVPLSKLFTLMEKQNEMLMSIMDKIVDLIIRVFKKNAKS